MDTTLRRFFIKRGFGFLFSGQRDFLATRQNLGPQKKKTLYYHLVTTAFYSFLPQKPKFRSRRSLSVSTLSLPFQFLLLISCILGRIRDALFGFREEPLFYL